MAPSATNIICFICVLSFFSVQIQCRESQFFFSKVPISSNSNNYVQVTPKINKEEQSLSKQIHQEPTTGFAPETFNKQKEPSFIPETRNGYGLYGQENNNVKYEPYTTPITSTPTGTFEPYTATTTPTTTTSAAVKYEPYTTPITSTPTGTFEPFTTTTTTTPTTTTTSVSAVKYEPYTTPITSTPSGTFEPYSTTPTTSYNNNANKYYYNNNNNGFVTEQESLGDSKFQESEKQGISDTRYLEKGRYYYDVKNENNYHPNQYQQQKNSRGYYSRNTFENNNNSIEGYPNEENEFDQLP